MPDQERRAARRPIKHSIELALSVAVLLIVSAMTNSSLASSHGGATASGLPEELIAGAPVFRQASAAEVVDAARTYRQANEHRILAELF